MIRVRMLRPHFNLMKGEFAGFPPETADDLIKRGIAVAYDPVAAAKAVAEAKAAEEATKAEAEAKADEEAAKAEADAKASDKAKGAAKK